MKSPPFIQLHHDSAEVAREELLKGLPANPQPGGAQVGPKLGGGLDFSHPLDFPPEAGVLGDGPRLLFYPGSGTDNFTPGQGRFAVLRAGAGA